MGTIIGVAIGYVLGARAGEESWAEFQDAWKVISSSEEVRDLVAGGFTLGRDLLGRPNVALSGSPSPAGPSGLPRVA